MSDTEHIEISEDEMVKLIAASKGRALILGFGANRAWLKPNCEWPRPLLEEWRGETMTNGAGI